MRPKFSQALRPLVDLGPIVEIRYVAEAINEVPVVDISSHNEADEVDWSSRRREIIAIYLKLANYERKEISSLLELYLWKMKMNEVGPNGQTADREFCRVNSGASIVIPHVLSFLDSIDEASHYFVLQEDLGSLR
eukprot:scaffold2594_cov85-Cylindrotheca_fusiformis.AAC.8